MGKILLETIHKIYLKTIEIFQLIEITLETLITRMEILKFLEIILVALKTKTGISLSNNLTSDQLKTKMEIFRFIQTMNEILIVRTDQLT